MQPITRLTSRLRRLVGEDGQDLLEYGLLAALIAILAIGAISTVGQTIYNVFWKSIETAF
jgi:Flp pilus assembly pilin Flp